MSDRIFRMMLRGLVDRVGGFDAAQAVIEAASGPFSKGTLSKMCSGQAAVTLEAMIALENASGVYPLTRRLFERIGAGEGEGDDLRHLLAELARDSGAAVSELAMGLSPASPDAERLTEAERARVNVAARQLRADCDRVIAQTEAARAAATVTASMHEVVHVPVRPGGVR